MDGNNWRAAHAHAQLPGQVMGAEPVVKGAMEDGDWRGQLQPESRQRIVNKIMETLKRHLPYSGQEGLQELKKIAVRFEEKIYLAATNQSDYLRKISMKMLTMETKSQNPDSMQPGGGNNSQDPASQSMQTQIQNQVQQLQLPMVSNQSQVRQQILSQNLHNNIAMNGVPNSAGLSSALPAMSGTMPNVPGPNANIQSMQSLPNMSSNGIGNSMGQGMPTGAYANQQRQIQNRQQPVTNQEQPQQSQGSHQYVYNQQVFMKQKFQQSGIPQQSMMQGQVPQQQQQQNLMQPNQLQSSQQAVMQPSLRQTSSPSSSSSSTLQNPQSSLQHSNQSLLQQPSQSVLRQQQQPQATVMHQQQNSMTQHSILSSQQQHHTSQQPNAPNIQPNQLVGQQNIAVDTQQQQRMMVQQNSMANMQQQHAVSKQNNLPSLHQQQSVAQQNNISNVHQQQFGSQNNISGFQQQQVQQMQGSMPNMLPNQPQSQPVQHQLMSQMQSQPGQMQQQLGMQQQANALSRDMQQRIQTSGPLNQQQSAIDQKQLIQPQRVIGETQINPSSQIGKSSGGDWQEEVYQKIKSMHDMYYHELNETYQRMVAKLQQHDSIPQVPKSEQLEKLHFFKTMLERLLMFLRISKNEIQPGHKDKTVQVEKQIISILNSNRPRKPVSSLPKGQPGQPHMLTVQQPQQQQPQISQLSEGQMNAQMQSLNAQGSVVNSLSSLQHGSMSSASGVPNSRQSMMDVMQPGSNIDAGQGSALSQMQQVAMNSLQQNSVSGQQQMNMTSVTSQAGMPTLASAVNPLQGNSNMNQGQQIKQEPQMFPSQQMKQQYQRQYIQRQQILQQQQLQSQQQGAQMPGQQMAHLNQMNDANDVKLRHQMVGKTGILHPHSSSQRPAYHHQSFSMPSQQALQVPSPQMAHHSSPQMEQQSLLVSHTKVGTPLQSANSPFVAPSPSTSVAPSPMPGDSEKIVSGVTSQSNAGSSLNPPTSAASLQNQSLAIGTPGISASPLLAEFSNPDGTHGVLSNAVPGSTSAVERPLDRLIKAVKSLSPVALSVSINDISSVVSLTDRIAGSAPGNGSRAAMGEDLVAMTKCRLQARNFFSKDGSGGTKRMRRYTSAMTSNAVPCTGSTNESLRNTGGNESYGQSTELACMKRPKHEAHHVLEEELQEINMGLIDTVVHISDDVDPTSVAAAAECAEGTVVKCSFRAVGLGPNLKSQFASAQMSPIQPLRLLIPKEYPSCSPVLLDKFPIEVSKEYEDLSMKAKSRFSISLRTLTQPMSLGDIARTWDRCARDVISEYAQLSGGGTFSSKYGNWEKCLNAA